MATQKWQESVSGFDRIDRESGVIRRVKILGEKSKNGRRYLKEARVRAVPRYEGKKVYIDHALPGSGARPTRERWGKLENVAEGGDGLYGDLHYLKKHPMTESLLEAVERFRDSGLSHDAAGEIQEHEGEKVVVDIAEVYSVDFVTDPATNKNLFESTQSLSLQQVLSDNLQSGGASMLALLSEMQGIDLEETIEGIAEGDLHGAFRAAALQIIDGEGELEEKLDKLRQLIDARLQMKGKSMSVDEATKKIEELSARLQEVTSKLEEANKVLESTQAENKELKEAAELEKQKEGCRTLLVEAKREVSDVRVKALLPLEEEDRKLLVESWPEQKASGGEGNKPGSSQSKLNEAEKKRLEEQQGGGDEKLPESYDDFKAAVLG